MRFYDLAFWVLLAARVVLPVAIFWRSGVSAIVHLVLDILDGGAACQGVMRAEDYQKIDKLLDWWWFVFILGWIYMNMNSYFLVMFILFLWRTIGEMMFFGSGKRGWLVVFPNFFEFVWWGLLVFGPWGVWVWPVGTFCVIREYLIHVRNFSARRILGLPVNWVK